MREHWSRRRHFHKHRFGAVGRLDVGRENGSVGVIRLVKARCCSRSGSGNTAFAGVDNGSYGISRTTAVRSPTAVNSPSAFIRVPAASTVRQPVSSYGRRHDRTCRDAGWILRGSLYQPTVPGTPISAAALVRTAVTDSPGAHYAATNGGLSVLTVDSTPVFPLTDRLLQRQSQLARSDQFARRHPLAALYLAQRPDWQQRHRQLQRRHFPGSVQQSAQSLPRRNGLDHLSRRRHHRHRRPERHTRHLAGLRARHGRGCIASARPKSGLANNYFSGGGGMAQSRSRKSIGRRHSDRRPYPEPGRRLLLALIDLGGGGSGASATVTVSLRRRAAASPRPARSALPPSPTLAPAVRGTLNIAATARYPPRR